MSYTCATSIQTKATYSLATISKISSNILIGKRFHISLYY